MEATAKAAGARMFLEVAHKGDVKDRDPDERRRDGRLYRRTGRAVLLLVAGSLGIALGIPGLHHHGPSEQRTNCAVCLTLGAQSWNLPIVATSLPVPPPAEGRPLLDQTPTWPGTGLGRDESPRGPPLL